MTNNEYRLYIRDCAIDAAWEIDKLAHALRMARYHGFNDLHEIAEGFDKLNHACYRVCEVMERTEMED